MSESGKPQGPLDADERALGMGTPITRRDFVGSAALGMGGALLQATCPAHALTGPPGVSAAPDGPAWTGYSGVGDFARSNGNTWEVVSAAHAMRDGQWSGKTAEAAASGEVYDLVVVGGGFSGLGAAYFFHQFAGAGKTCLVLDNHAVPGGEAKRNEFMVNGQRLIGPQGSNDTDLAGPTKSSTASLSPAASSSPSRRTITSISFGRTTSTVTAFSSIRPSRSGYAIPGATASRTRPGMRPRAAI
jgi:hypothetical protein